MECQQCKEITQKYLMENPMKKGHVLCMKCYEESLKYVVYVNLPYEPKSTNGKIP